MRSPARPVTVSVLWTVIGAVALMVVTAAITQFATSQNTADRTTELVTQVHKANRQITQLRLNSAADKKQAEADRELAVADEARATAERNLMREQYQVTQAQLLAVLTYLRAHGINIPPDIVNPPARPRPKDTGPRGPSPSTTSSSSPRPSPSPSPRPTSGTTPGPTTGPGITDLTCLLAPLLCP